MFWAGYRGHLAADGRHVELSCLVLMYSADIHSGAFIHPTHHNNHNTSITNTSITNTSTSTNINTSTSTSSNSIMNPSVYITAVLLFGAQGVKSHGYRAGRGRGARHRHHAWPAVFSNDVDTGAFRAFNSYPRGGGIFTPGAPLLDVFQEVFGDIKKGAVGLCNDNFRFATVSPPVVNRTSKS